MTPESIGKDIILGNAEHGFSSVISPRVLLLTKRGVPMVENKGWLGLPGGKVKDSESDGNLLSVGAFPTLIREVAEECGFNIEPYLKNSSACLGLAQIIRVDSVKRTLREMVTPIFVCMASDLKGGNSNVVWRDVNSKDFENIFPDARLAFQELHNKIKEGAKGSIFPEFLSHEIIYFQTSPTMRYLQHLPSWASKLVN